MQKKVAIVVSDFNQNITQKMVGFAEKKAKRLGLGISEIIHVPGAFEIPFALKNLLKSKKISGAIVLGAVIQGETDHDILVANLCARGVMKLSLKYNIPIGFAVMGPRIKTDMAERKAQEYSERAVETVAYMIEKFKK